MTLCSKCNTENRSGRRFCGECGAPLPFICDSCGFNNDGGEKFCGGCGRAVTVASETSLSVTPPLTSQAKTPQSEVVAHAPEASKPERRHLSIMFCDLVGSTSLASRLDPEDMSQVIHRYQQAASAAIHRYEGYVARFLGDGIMAYFGYPTAHENDAERALYAGLAVVDAVTELNDDPDRIAGVEYSVRVGIATGLAVVGDLIGAGSAAEEKAVVGKTPNLAARLQTIALPNSAATKVIRSGCLSWERRWPPPRTTWKRYL